MIYRRILGVLVGAATVAVASTAAAATSDSYPAYLGGPRHASYAKLATTLTPANAGTTHSIWKWSPDPKGTTSTYLYASPSTRDGVIYIGAGTGDFYAVDAATGKTKWKTTLGINKPGLRNNIHRRGHAGPSDEGADGLRRGGGSLSLRSEGVDWRNHHAPADWPRRGQVLQLLQPDRGQRAHLHGGVKYL